MFAQIDRARDVIHVSAREYRAVLQMRPSVHGALQVMQDLGGHRAEDEAPKGAEAVGIMAIQKAFHLDLPCWSVLLILAGLNVTTMVPVTPGNLGVYEATVFFIYQYLGIPSEKAMALAIFQHLCYLLPMVGPGYFFVIQGRLHPLRLQKDFPESSSP